MAELVVTMPNGKRVKHDLTLMPQDIGRDPTCHIQIDDATVSRRHADIRGDGNGQFSIRDLGSKNGTLVNNTPITTHVLRHGDTILFGSVPAQFHTEPQPPQTSSITVDEQVTLATQSISAVGSQRKLQLSQQRLERLYEISDRLTGLRNRQDLLNDIMRICIENFEFERAAIGVKQLSRRGMDWPVVHNMLGLDGEIRISRTILKQALDDGQRVILSDTAREMVDPTVSIVQQGTRSAMCVPIAYSDDILGVIYGDRISTIRKYEQEDVDYLAALARQVSIGLTNARLLEEQQQKVFLEKEIAIARQIQSDLFPETLELHPQVQIAALNEPGRQVSGDYYDVIKMEGERIGIVIADVVGKGVASALIAANLQAAIQLLMPECTDLGDLADKLNALVYRNTDVSRFITSILAVVDPQNRRLDFVNAGHHPPIHICNAQINEVISEDTSLPFGIEEELDYRSISVDLGPDPSTLFFYTDGLNEAMDDNETEYGIERIFSTLQEYHDARPQRLLDVVRQSVNAFSGTVPQRDDITLIALKC